MLTMLALLAAAPVTGDTFPAKLLLIIAAVALVVVIVTTLLASKDKNDK